MVTAEVQALCPVEKDPSLIGSGCAAFTADLAFGECYLRDIIKSMVCHIQGRLHGVQFRLTRDMYAI